MLPRSTPLRLLASALFHNPALLHIFWTWKCARFCVEHRAKKPAFGAGVRFNNLDVEDLVTLHDACQLFNVRIGRMSYVGRATQIVNAQIGRFCSIGPDVRIGLGGTHPTDRVSTHPAFYSPMFRSQMTFADRTSFDEFPGPVVVGNDVWIGAGATISDGVSIGDGAVIAARSMVTKNVPAYAIVGGVPAKLIRHRIPEEVIPGLLDTAWWNRDIAWLKAHCEDFQNVRQFVASHTPQSP